MEYEDQASINSELRFITLELMKIASGRNVPFDVVLAEFLQNTLILKASLKTGTVSPRSRSPRKVASPASNQPARVSKPARK